MFDVFSFFSFLLQVSVVKRFHVGVLVVSRIFSLIDMITNTKISNRLNVLKICVVRQ